MTTEEFTKKVENLFADFLEKWRNKGIELKIELHDTQSIELLAKPFDEGDHYEVVLAQNAKGVVLEPQFLADMVGWEITYGRNIYIDSFIQFLDIAREFVTIVRDVPLEDGTEYMEMTPAFWEVEADEME